VNTPQVWNSNMYCSTETMELLDGVIDVYLTDFKYGNDKCAERLSKVSNYLEIITRNHILAYNQAEVLIRHLVMPHHVECCSKPLLSWIATHLPHAAVNIMVQYRPEYKASDYDDISRCPKNEEIQEVYRHAETLGLSLI
jgi:putative pyruvate formate lyase activating enzyme